MSQRLTHMQSAATQLCVVVVVVVRQDTDSKRLSCHCPTL